MIRLAAFCAVVSIALSGIAIAAECTAVWRKLDAEFIEKMKENPSLIIEPGFELRSNDTLPLSSSVYIHLRDPNAPQTKLFMDVLDQVASIIDLKLTLAAAPIIATIGVGVIDESGIPTETFHEALESFVVDAEERAELLTAMNNDVTMRYVEKTTVFVTSGKSRAPARRFIAIGTTRPANIRTLAVLSVVGSRYQRYARACEGYQGMFLFNSGFDELQPDDFRLFKYIYSLSNETSSKIDR